MTDSPLRFTLTSGTNTTEVSAAGISSFQRILTRNLVLEFNAVAEKIISQMALAYRRHEREADAGAASSSRPSITERLSDALVYHVKQSAAQGTINLQLFNLHAADIGTSQQQWGDPATGWFDLVEDGHAGLDHGSTAYGFVSIELAAIKVEECIEQEGIEAQEAQSFRTYVGHKFAGKYGMGIMTALDRPLFFKYPDFGTASQHGVEPHPGFTAWNVVRSMHTSAMSSAPGGIAHAIQRAMQKTQLELGAIR